MGFSDISLAGSDAAADLNATVEKASTTHHAIKLLSDALDKEEGRYNTPGYVNVALVLTEGAGRQLFADCYGGKYEQLLDRTAFEIALAVRRLEDTGAPSLPDELDESFLKQMKRLLDDLIVVHGEHDERKPRHDF